MNLLRIRRGLTKVSRSLELLRAMRLTTQWWQLASAYIFKSELEYPFQIETRAGAQVSIKDWDDLTTVWRIFFGREYLLPHDCESVLDLGGNIGAFAIWAVCHQQVGKVFTVEPSPQTYEQLTDNIKLNELTSQIIPYQLAVGEFNGVSQFSGTSSRSYCRRLLPSGELVVDAIDVEAVTLRTLLERLGIEKIDCLKMDIEGGEYGVFKSASNDDLRCFQTITLEYHDSARADALWTKLKSAGFQLKKLRKEGWSGTACWYRV